MTKQTPRTDMSARELLELAEQLERHATWYHHAKALRDYAALLAAVEESGEEVVRDLGRTHMMLNNAGQHIHAENCERAAALLVARSAEVERLKAENKALREHAGAMHKWIDRVLSWAERVEQDIGGEELGDIIPDGGPIYEAYRAAKGTK